jgi:hypothetical protein
LGRQAFALRSNWREANASGSFSLEDSRRAKALSGHEAFHIDGAAEREASVLAEAVVQQAIRCPRRSG